MPEVFSKACELNNITPHGQGPQRIQQMMVRSSIHLRRLQIYAQCAHLHHTNDKGINKHS